MSRPEKLRINYLGLILPFLLLEGLFLYFVVQFNSAQKEIFVENWGLVSAAANERYENIRSYLSVNERLSSLEDENAFLHSQLPNAKSDGRIARDSVVDDSLVQVYTFTAAQVINRSPFGPYNTFILDRGSIQGINVDRGVLASRGLLGIITHVSEHYARGLSILHRDIRISAAIRGRNFFGTLQWDGKDARYMDLLAIPRYVDVTPGDTVATTGYSQFFPTDVPIGTVYSVEPIKGGNNWSIRVELLNKPLDDRTGYVVNHLFKGEIDALEKLTSE
jgi:rod shape-determining protein MreC